MKQSPYSLHYDSSIINKLNIHFQGGIKNTSSVF